MLTTYAKRAQPGLVSACEIGLRALGTCRNVVLRRVYPLF